MVDFELIPLDAYALEDTYEVLPPEEAIITSAVAESNPEVQQPLGCTLAQYAEVKRLPVEFLKRLGLKEQQYGGAPSVRIPYYDAAGQEQAVRFRTALEGKDRFRWKKGTKLTHLYSNASVINPNKSTILVEGESDCQTLWYHGICAFGIPGASSWKEDYAVLLALYDMIYVLIEPDEGGQTMLKWLSRSQIRHKVRLVRLDGFKDPSAMHCDNPESFVERWEQALTTAMPLANASEILPPPASIQSANCSTKADLEIIKSNLPESATALGQLLAAKSDLFDRGGPAQVVDNTKSGGREVLLLTHHGVVNACHKIAQPFEIRSKSDGTLYRFDTTLPERVAGLYLDRKGESGLRPLDGISYAPLLFENGTMRATDGYDSGLKLLCVNMPEIKLLEKPTRHDAEAALLYLRNTFKTFAFADSKQIYDPKLETMMVDLTAPPGRDESALLMAILTAVCRSSLWLAPAIVVQAPSFSGAGTGKGLLLRGVSALAFGTRPEAMTPGGSAEEFEKRVSAALIGAKETLLLDNINGTTLKSDVLASVLTERPCRVRPLGSSTMVPLNASTLILITGNGLILSEDMVRRCITLELDAGIEDPEQRTFKKDFVADVLADRSNLLRDALTIWRWGRQNEGSLSVGRAIGSYSQWSQWVRDPLLSLGCCDPVERIAAAKANDPRRRAITELFNALWEAHRNNPVTVAGLDQKVQLIADPQQRGRQFLAAHLRKLEGTRAAGFVLQRHAPDGKWTADTYQLHRTSEAQSMGEHRGARAPMPPMPPDDDEA